LKRLAAPAFQTVGSNTFNACSPQLASKELTEIKQTLNSFNGWQHIGPAEIEKFWCLFSGDQSDSAGLLFAGNLRQLDTL